MKAVIAIDGSSAAATALQTAARMLRSDELALEIVCVAPRFGQRRKTHEQSTSYQQRALREMTQILQRAGTGLPPTAGQPKLVPLIGSPAGVLVKKSAEHDVTVIGPRGRGSTGGLGLGPVASRVVEHASSPVLIARKLQSEEGLRILVAVDGSDSSLRAIEILGHLVDLTLADICLMHVAETPWVELDPGEDWNTYSEEDKDGSEAGAFEKELIREGETVMEQARERLAPYRVAVTTLLVEGNPANEILSEADRGSYDLVVVGATGERDLKHRMLGSVSSKVAWNAPCSVLIVTSPA